ncbi:MAG: triose-phosphate isomerase [Candidatus Zixiibacteriota bacterium]|nr:MAG: triose-phosphate isomerase [candidate division Zixibacteria bacterium]
MRQMIIAGNWKMNGTVPETEALLKALVDGDSRSGRARVVVCPPFTSLYTADGILKGTHIALGAQDVSAKEKGAYTSEVSVAMLLTVGVQYVILGHSEKRQYHAESDRLVNEKAKLVIGNGLTPIICVGETLEQREKGLTEKVVGEQVDGTLSGFSADFLGKSVIAYEPVWAIGTGKTATPQMAQEVHAFIRNRVAGIDPKAAENLPILYGGSVKPDNAKGLLEQADIDGALVGGASLKADDFIAIIKAA